MGAFVETRACLVPRADERGTADPYASAHSPLVGDNSIIRDLEIVAEPVDEDAAAEICAGDLEPVNPGGIDGGEIALFREHQDARALLEEKVRLFVRE